MSTRFLSFQVLSELIKDVTGKLNKSDYDRKEIKQQLNDMKDTIQQAEVTQMVILLVRISNFVCCLVVTFLYCGPIVIQFAFRKMLNWKNKMLVWKRQSSNFK